jgi:2-phospho-L-lactate guanylyltransferase (CobY/MobA/RfbA family)
VRVVIVAGEGVHDVLVRRTSAWAQALDADPVLVADEEQARAALGAGPVVVVWADTPRLGDVHATGVRRDLAEGAAVVVAPALDGGVYLVAMAQPRPELVGPGFARVLEIAAEHRLETGMLRHERRLTRPEDARALLADPLLDDNVRAALRSD